MRTPHFDRVAAEGALFTHAFCASPSCTPSRGGILTGQAIHRLEEGGNLHSTLPAKFAVYPDLLEQAGYAVGFMGKRWGPGNHEAGGRDRNPTGSRFKDFGSFLATVGDDQPFCFWFGSADPHRPYQPGSGREAGLDPERVRVHAAFPDLPAVRDDILDYYAEVERFDRDVGQLLSLLAARGLLDPTIVVITSDNGMPFPRAKTNLYDLGTRMPMAVRWPAWVEKGRVIKDLVSHCDLAPTFLEAAGLARSDDMTGRSLLPLLAGKHETGRDRVFLERERHAQVRRGDLGYPMRAVRTEEFLYIRNFRPDRWPAGDPEHYFSVGDWGDIDNSPTKSLIAEGREEPAMARFFGLGFEKRPAEELYDLRKDPEQINNVAGKRRYFIARRKLRAMLQRWMEETGDPRVDPADDRWDRYPYYGSRAKP